MDQASEGRGHQVEEVLWGLLRIGQKGTRGVVWRSGAARVRGVCSRYKYVVVFRPRSNQVSPRRRDFLCVVPPPASDAFLHVLILSGLLWDCEVHWCSLDQVEFLLHHLCVQRRGGGSCVTPERHRWRSPSVLCQTGISLWCWRDVGVI